MIPSLAFSRHLLGDKPARKCRKTLSPRKGGDKDLRRSEDKAGGQRLQPLVSAVSEVSG